MTVCSACGQENPAGSKFCNACGTPLTDQAAVAAEERKVVTVVFADLVGFTARSERLDPEDVRAILRPYHARLKTEFERFGGTVEKFIGDAVMAVFGAPVAHEDDPERAARAAIAIRDALAEEDGMDVRIGITTGEALVMLGARPEMGEGIASGDVVNTAARLQSGAAVNEILVDEKTYRATERVIDYEPADELVAKGKSAPIPVWRALRPRARVGVERQGGAPLVGRETELSLLRDTLTRVLREKEPQLVTLVGVPGIGKSRLIYELFKAIEEGTYGFVYWRHGRSLPYGEGVTFWALSEIVKAQSNILESDDADGARAKLGATIADLAADEREAAWLERHLAPLVGVAETSAHGTDGRAEAFAAWRRFFEVLAERRPLVLVFEDLHWADDALLDFVDEIVEWARGVPILVVATARPELLARRRDWSGGKVNSSTILVSPLSGHESALLLQALLGTSVLAAETQARLLERAGGNPLYAEEFARLFAEQRGDVALPESVHGMIAARLDALPHDEKQLLQDASVLGRVFWLGGLVATVSEEQLRPLERKEFIRRERRSSVAGESEYAFRHALVRDVAYEQIPRNQRAQKHRAAANWIESLGRPDDHAEMLAHHYLSAVELSRSTGGDDGLDRERAREALIRAGDRAMSLNATEAAARYFESAAGFVARDDVGRPHLVFRLARARLNSADPRSTETLIEARDALIECKDSSGAAEAETMLAETAWYAGDRQLCDRHLERALKLIEGQPASAAKAYVLSQLARYSMLANEEQQAIEYGHQALALADEFGLDEIRAHALNSIGTSKSFLGDFKGGVQDLEASVEIGRRIRSAEAVRALNNLCVLVWGVRGLRESRPIIDAAVEAGRELGHVPIWRHAAGQQIVQILDSGDWEDGLRRADEYLDRNRLASADESIIRRLARIRLARGDMAGALGEVRAMLALAQSSREPQARIPTISAAIRFFYDAEMIDDAKRLADTFFRDFRQTLPAWMFVELAWAVGLVGRHADVRAAAEHDVQSVYGQAALALVDDDFVRAAQVFNEIGEAENEAAAKLRAAATGDPDAAPLVEEALEFYRGVGATAWVAKGERLLDELSGRGRARARR